MGASFGVSITVAHPDTVSQAGTHAISPTERRIRCRSRRQKLDLAVRAGVVVLAIIAVLYDKAHDNSPHSSTNGPSLVSSRSL
jgi:hypothetical protein